MMEHGVLVNAQYGVVDLATRIFARLVAAGKDPDRLTRDDLASFDEFHAGGRESTRELVCLAALSQGSTVLDVGCGIGGPARTLASEFACRVTGIDLARDYCQTARMLTEKLGMDERVQFLCADALDLPFAPSSFDVVWSQNVFMNIGDKARFLREVVRVLRPGGLFAFETILAGPAPGCHLPVFWADSADLNLLVTEAQTKALLSESGLRLRDWQDTTQRSVALQRTRQEINTREGPPLLSLDVIVPHNFRAKVENVLRNNLEGRTRTVQAICCL